MIFEKCDTHTQDRQTGQTDYYFIYIDFYLFQFQVICFGGDPVKLKASTPEISSGEEVDRGGVLENEADG